MQALLKRRLQEPDGATVDAYSLAELQALLGLGLIEVQKRILAADPDAIAANYDQDIVSGTEDYAMRSTDWHLKRALKLDTTSGKYKPIGRISLAETDARTAADISADSELRYALFGRSVRLSPVPASNQTDGLRLVVVPTVAMASDSAEPTPEIHPALHMLVVLEAALLALPEKAEARPELLEERNRHLSFLDFYRRSEEHVPLSVGVEKGY